MNSILLAVDLLLLAAKIAPKIAPAVRELIESFKKEPVEDISQEEFELRIDAAIAKLPVWE